MEFLLPLIIIGALIWAPAIFVAQRQRKDHRRLESQIRLLDQGLAKFQARIDALEAGQAPSKPTAENDSGGQTPAPTATDELDYFTAAHTPEAPRQPQEAEPPAEEPLAANKTPIDETAIDDTPVEEAPDLVPAAAAQARTETTTRAGEEAFTSSWLIWIGGITMALGGAFIVKYSIDQGWIGPAVRILMGIAAGAGMLGVGEYLRRSADKVLFKQQAPDYLPGTLTGAGIATLYAAIWAAFGLYDLIPSFVAFVALAAVAFLSLALGLLHGPAIAALGILGASIVPAIVSTGSRNTPMLFTYLALVSAGGMAIVKYRQWWGLGALTLGAALAWVFIWLATAGTGESIISAGLYIMAITAIGLWATQLAEDQDSLTLRTKPMPSIIAMVVTVISALLIISLSHLDTYQLGGILFTLAYAGVLLAAGWQRMEWLVHTAIAAVLVVFSLINWPIPYDWLPGDPASLFSLGSDYGRFTIVAILAAGMFGVVGFGAAQLKQRAGYWASISGAMPVLVLLITYFRWTDLSVDAVWAGAALGLALILTLCAERNQKSNVVLGAYATAACASLSIALAFYLRDAWLTVALALQLPAMAFICLRFGLPVLRHIALIVAAIVIIRLGLNPYIFDYQLAATPIINWLLWGYGAPAIAFWWAAKKFLTDRDDALVKVLEAGAIAFATMFVTLEIRSLFHSSLDAAYSDFTEVSIQSLVLMSIGYGLYRRNLLQHRVVLGHASTILRYGGLAHLFIMQGLVLNPLFNHVDVGAWPVVNQLMLAYLAPAVITALYARAAMARNSQLELTIMGSATLTLVFIYISMEVRHIFAGGYLDELPISDPEQYTYSAVWIIYGIGLLALGIWRNIRALRYASLGVLMLATAKVFIWDMSGLTGLLRAVSFLGLGGTLLAIGFVYQRFVFPATPPDNSPDDAAQESTS